ncbi:MAG: PfkB family carbohydrate kinase [Flavisolibacter sp.]
MRYQLCCIGHITQDKVVTSDQTAFLPGGTAFYFSQALAGFDLDYILITALAKTEIQAVESLQARGVKVISWPSLHTVYFENVYGEDPDQRSQRVLQQADPFTLEQVSGIAAEVFHLGPLLPGDMEPAVIKSLAAKGRLSLDVQGFLRRVENGVVSPSDWADKKVILPLIHYLKVNEYELGVLTGRTDWKESLELLATWGVKEIILTMGSKGSVVMCEGSLYGIPAFSPTNLRDATGCGDTYMAGYLYQRVKGANVREAGIFAAAMASVKIASSGPFMGDQNTVWDLVNDPHRYRANAFL